MNSQLPVTLIAGAPGANEAELLHQLRAQSGPQRVTGIVPKTRRTPAKPGLVPTTVRLQRMGKGCSCCTVRSDVLVKVRKIAKAESADHVLIQAPASADLNTLTKTFTVADEHGRILSDVATLQTLVVVLRKGSLRAQLASPSGEALVARIALADAVVAEGAEEADAALIRAINPHAAIVTDSSAVNLAELQAEQPFELVQAQRRAELDHVFRQERPVAQHGVLQFAYRARRPFRAERLHQLLHDPVWGQVVLAKGAFWIASEHTQIGMLDTLAGKARTSAAGRWWAAVPPDQLPDSPSFRQRLQAVWHPAFGDRMQELALIAHGVDHEALRTKLDACLLTPAELTDPAQWPEWNNPLGWAVPE